MTWAQGSCLKVSGSCLKVSGSCWKVSGSSLKVSGSSLKVSGSALGYGGFCLPQESRCTGVGFSISRDRFRVQRLRLLTSSKEEEQDRPEVARLAILAGITHIDLV